LAPRRNKTKRTEISSNPRSSKAIAFQRYISTKTGFEITVEKCNQRIFNDFEFESIGCKLVEKGSWRKAPADALIFGLKELPENDQTPLTHTHIMFAHCYKQQDGWEQVLGRFVNGNGLLYDLEFLMVNNRRVAAYGYYAGFAGCAVGLDVWCHQILHPGVAYPKINPFENEGMLITHIKERLALACNITLS
jgi:saccharopine dehydrogenase (NAD+, L-lysine-forming)